MTDPTDRSTDPLTPEAALAEAMREEGIAPFRSRSNAERHGPDVRYTRNAADLISRLASKGIEVAARASASTVTPDGLDAAYRERNAVIAALFRTNGWPVYRVDAPDAPGWFIVYAETPEGQVSWHVSPQDIDLFDPPVGGATWDGHDTDEKYRRVAALRAEARPPDAARTSLLYGDPICQCCHLPDGPERRAFHERFRAADGVAAVLRENR